jgi:RHS repeat-associated protein
LVADSSKGLKISYDWRGMPVEFLLEPTGSSSDTTRLVMMYDGSGRRISKALLTKSAATTSWDMVKVTLSQPSDKVTENFTGKERDDETKLNYFGARYLDPMLGMWISVDPARQFASPYLYAGNGYNPVDVIDPDGNITIPKPHPLAVFSGVALGIANCAQIQYAYESNGGKDYMTEVALGFSAYMLTVAFSVIGINTDNIMKASMTSGAINAFTSGGFNAAIQYFTTGTVNTYDVGTEMAKGAITGMIGGAVSYGLSEYWGGNLKSPLTGEHIYPESGAMAGFLGDGTVQVLMNVIVMENTNAKQESVMDEK